MNNTYTLSQPQTDSPSGLTFRLRQPSPSKPLKCLLLLHGVGSNETDLLPVADGVHPDTLVVLVRGPLPMGPQQFAWFSVSFTATGPKIVASEAEQSRKALIQLVGSLQTQYSIAPLDTVIAGFSQGGIMSASVALSEPEQVKGFGLLSGRILPELEPVIASQERLAQLKAFVGHGEYDSKLPVQWAQKSDTWLTALGVAHDLHLYPIDHTINAQMHQDFIRWITSLG
jgi:phospholipase/carboxylesterase